MTDRNEIRAQVEELLGSEGSRELAEAMVKVLESEGFITFDASEGFQLAEDIDESKFMGMLAQADSMLERTETQSGTAKTQLEIMIAALPIIRYVPHLQDTCWPGDGPAHDDHCKLGNHSESLAAVKATEGISWDFSSWSQAAEWFEREIAASNSVNGFVVFHRDQAGHPPAFDGGPWFYEPEGWQGDVFSKGHPTRDAAIEAAENDQWADEELPR